MKEILTSLAAGAVLCCALTACTGEKAPSQSVPVPSPGYVAAQPGPTGSRSRSMEQDRTRRDPLANGRYRAFPDGRVYGGQGNAVSRKTDDLLRDGEKAGKDAVRGAEDFLRRTEDTLQRMSEPGKRPG